MPLPALTSTAETQANIDLPTFYTTHPLLLPQPHHLQRLPHTIHIQKLQHSQIPKSQRIKTYNTRTFLKYACALPISQRSQLLKAYIDALAFGEKRENTPLQHVLAVLKPIPQNEEIYTALLINANDVRDIYWKTTTALALAELLVHKVPPPHGLFPPVFATCTNTEILLFLLSRATPPRSLFTFETQPREVQIALARNDPSLLILHRRTFPELGGDIEWWTLPTLKNLPEQTLARDPIFFTGHRSEVQVWRDLWEEQDWRNEITKLRTAPMMWNRVQEYQSQLPVASEEIMGTEAINKRKWSYAFEQLKSKEGLEAKMLAAKEQYSIDTQFNTTQPPEEIIEPVMELPKIDDSEELLDDDNDIKISLKDMTADRAIQLYEGSTSGTDRLLLNLIRDHDLQDDTVCKQLLQKRKIPSDAAAEFWLPYFAHMGVPNSGNRLALVITQANTPEGAFLLHQIYPKVTEFVKIILDGLRTCLPGPISIYTLTLAAAMVEVIDNPKHVMFSPVCNFLLKKPRWHEECLLLYETLGSVDQTMRAQCQWMLGILRTGVCSLQDWSIVRKRHVASLLYRTYLVNNDFEVIKTLETWTALTDICIDLVVHHGLLAFLGEIECADRLVMLGNIDTALDSADWTKWFVDIADVKAAIYMLR